MNENKQCSQSDCAKESCEGCANAQGSFKKESNAFSNIKHVIGVISGKGGVGKSMATASLAVAMAKEGYKVGILDSDITGPSIPKMFGLHGPAEGTDEGIFPSLTKLGVKVMSVNLLLENEETPVLWRGPVIANMVSQFWTDVMWGELDYLFVDMPPGTGDVALTVFQSLPVDGAILITSPQDLVGLIVKKAYHMAEDMNIPILGLVENFSYFKCPDCGKEHAVFGESHLEEIAAQMSLPVLDRLPIDPQLANAADHGTFEEYDNVNLPETVKLLKGMENKD